MLTPRRLCAFAAIFAALFVLMLPIRPVYTVQGGIEIRATGEKNVAALSSEVWVMKESSDMLLAAGTQPKSGWEIRDGAFLSFQGQPSALDVNTPFAAGSKLMFLRHPYSGIVEVLSGGARQRFDLYATSGGPLVIQMDRLPGARVSWERTIGYAVLAFLGGFVLFYIAGWFFGRNGNKGDISTSRDIHLIRVLAFAAPGFVIYFISLLIYWPAQMSPDSVTQWNEMVTGRYNDSHPILSTLLYAAVYQVSPHPQALVVAQALCFSLAGGFALSEAMSWGARRPLVILAAVAFPLYPANFLLASTLWKDVPFAIGILLITVLAARIIRLQMHVSRLTAVALTIIGIIILGVRHNGILIVLPFVVLMAWCAKDRGSRFRLGIVLVVQVAAFVILKTVLLSAFNASSIGPHYKAIYALHTLGAMQKASVEWSQPEQELLDATLPRDEWLSSYHCDNVVPLFWSPSISYPFLAQNAGALNKLALRAIFDHPAVFLRHQLCVASLVWRITANPQEHMAFSPQIIVDMPLSRELGLKMESKFPVAMEAANAIANGAWERYAYLFRGGIYVLLGVFGTILLMGRIGKTAGLIFVPSLLNAASMAVMTGSQDYRYMWPTAIGSMFLLLIVVGSARYRGRPFGKSPISGDF